LGEKVSSPDATKLPVRLAVALLKDRNGRIQLDVPIDAKPPQLPGMTGPEVTAADLAATRIAPDQHPISHLRPELDRHGIVPIAGIGRDLDRRRITVAGHVTHRQRPGTAGGVTFLNLEDETGMLNIVCSTATWQRYRRTV